MRPEALLAIRSDIANAVEQDYLEWLTREHTIERVGIGGFLSARIFRAAHSGFGRYLILYELADARVVDSPAYLERLNNPTPWTTRMMPHLGNFVRGGGAVTAKLGAGYGAAIVAMMMTAELPEHACGALETISKEPGVAAIRILQTDIGRTTIVTNERKLRSLDQSFEALLILEAFDEAVARRAAKTLPSELIKLEDQHSASHTLPVYLQIFRLDAELPHAAGGRHSQPG
jgi:hypothetical protein